MQASVVTITVRCDILIDVRKNKVALAGSLKDPEAAAWTRQLARKLPKRGIHDTTSSR